MKQDKVDMCIAHARNREGKKIVITRVCLDEFSQFFFFNGKNKSKPIK